MKIGIYGGSFNPIHFGHIGLAKWVTEHTDLDQVWLMVSPNNPLKDKTILADEQERLDAAKEAIRRESDEAKDKIIVSDFEFHLPRPNYTANTLRELQKQYPQHEFTLIIGEDNLNIFNKWREYQYILDTYRIFVYPRRNIISQTSQQHEDILRKANNVKLLADAPYFDISSTELRKNLHN
jgi:nicotinate-nucleotide adenylyltransferase